MKRKLRLDQHDRHVLAWINHWMLSPTPPDECTAQWIEQALVFEQAALH